MSTVGKVKKQIATAIATAAAEAIAAGEINPPAQDAGDLLSLGSIPVEVPNNPQHGDFASSQAMLMARACRQSPLLIANAIARHLHPEGTYIASVEVAGGGFLNFRLKRDWLWEALQAILLEGPAYGRSDAGQKKRVLLEFVSANPVGPMTVVQARAGAIGDSVGNIMQAAGFVVEREYYINDAGAQVNAFARSVEARFRELAGESVPFPEDGYRGEYVVDVAAQFMAQEGATLRSLEPDERVRYFETAAITEMVRRQKAELDRYRVHFDHWVSERHLRASGALEDTMGILRARQRLYESEGATWLRTTDLGDDKDRVVVKSDGTYTYFLPDIAYHRDKFNRGFDVLIDILGPDHHGYIGRMKAAMAALGYQPERLEIIIHGLVRLFREGELVRHSKRHGEIVTLDELLEEVGVDAARFFFVMRAPDQPLDFDLTLAASHSQDNPVYYVQYAHARICSILRQAEAEGTPWKPGDPVDFRVLTDPHELDLIRTLADLPDEIVAAARTRTPHILARYVQDVAAAFHLFYDNCRVLTPDEPVRRGRLALSVATRTVIANVLALLGVEAPERM